MDAALRLDPRRTRSLGRHPLVLAYHAVGSCTDGEDPERLVVSPERLRAQVRLLTAVGYRFATAADLLRGRGGRDRTAVLSFDDGWLDALTIVAPMLEALGARATFFVCPGMWGKRSPYVRGDAGRLLSADQARELHLAGHELGAHTMTHPDLRALDDDELARELRESKAAIERLTGEPCRTFAYPFGYAGEREIAAVRDAGFELGFGWGADLPRRRHALPRLAGPTRHGAAGLAAKLAGLRPPE